MNEVTKILCPCHTLMYSLQSIRETATTGNIKITLGSKWGTLEDGTILITETALLCKTNDTFQVAYTKTNLAATGHSELHATRQAQWLAQKQREQFSLSNQQKYGPSKDFSTFLLIVYTKLSLTKATSKEQNYYCTRSLCKVYWRSNNRVKMRWVKWVHSF